jgi:[ribosomal protein S5]-alanine N-acetyltransferase
MGMVCASENLELRHLTLDDAAFMLRLLNEPSYIEFIADRKVRSLDDAKQYLEQGPLHGYAQYGLGSLLVVERSTQKPVGIHGLISRPTMPHPDLGYAFVPEAWGKGYATEGGQAVLNWARDEKALSKVCAFTALNHPKSQRVLTRLGFTFVKVMPFGDSSESVAYFERSLE